MKQIGECLDMAAVDPLQWAYLPTSQMAITAIFEEARKGGVFAAIRDMHIALGICDDDGLALRLWSFVADDFVAPPWYVRVNAERIAA